MSGNLCGRSISIMAGEEARVRRRKEQRQQEKERREPRVRLGLVSRLSPSSYNTVHGSVLIKGYLAQSPSGPCLFAVHETEAGHCTSSSARHGLLFSLFLAFLLGLTLGFRSGYLLKAA
jgi:hypothetical protein